MRCATQRLQHVDVCKTQRSQIEDDGFRVVEKRWMDVGKVNGMVCSFEWREGGWKDSFIWKRQALFVT